MKLARLVVPMLALALLATVLTIFPAGASSGAGVDKVQRLRPHEGTAAFRGVVDISKLPVRVGENGPAQPNDFRLLPERDVPKSGGSGPSGLEPPSPPNTLITTNNPGFEGFGGLTHLDQRLADNGNQFSLEPPDSELCAKPQAYIFEAVNAAVQITDGRGNVAVGPLSLNQFFDYPPNINRETGEFGPFVFDPKCYRDPVSQRWYLTVDVLFTDPGTGDFTGETALGIAVSKGKNPTREFYLYELDSTHQDLDGCPCFDDHPLTGADQYGYWISANIFGMFTDAYHGAILYGISKSQLEAGQPANLVIFGPDIPLAEGIAYSVQTANSPTGADWDTDNGGTAYALSSLEFTGGLDNRIAAWAATNTSALDTDPTQVMGQYVVIDSPVYGTPPKSEQRRGPHPLGTSVGEELNALDSGGDEMQEVDFDGNSLWSGVDTVIAGESDLRAGFAWFQVTPSIVGGVLSAAVVNDGYVAVQNNDLLYGSVGVNTHGDGMIGFTLNGPNYYPSAAYAHLSVGGHSIVHIAAMGLKPEDGFTCYAAFVGDRERGCRWGDYGAAVADPAGRLWFVSEYIDNGPRTVNGNWATFIGKVNAIGED